MLTSVFREPTTVIKPVLTPMEALFAPVQSQASNYIQMRHLVLVCVCMSMICINCNNNYLHRQKFGMMYKLSFYFQMLMNVLSTMEVASVIQKFIIAHTLVLQPVTIYWDRTNALVVMVTCLTLIIERV